MLCCWRYAMLPRVCCFRLEMPFDARAVPLSACALILRRCHAAAFFFRHARVSMRTPISFDAAAAERLPRAA